MTKIIFCDGKLALLGFACVPARVKRVKPQMCQCEEAKIIF